MIISFRSSIALVLIASFLMMGCSASNTVKGGAIGAAAGGVLGAVIGKQAGNTALGAIIGAAVGGTAGVLIGRYMDKQAEEIQRDIQGAKVERVGEGIKITFDSGILFETGKSTLQAVARANIEKLSVILNKYKDTNVLVEGHTDSDGEAQHNTDLSQSRAQSVYDYLVSKSILKERMRYKGYGELKPVVNNDSPENKQLNRRTEIEFLK